MNSPAASKIVTVRTGDGGRSSFSCTVCGKVFEKRKSAVVHVGRHSFRPSLHECEECGRMFFSAVALTRHRKRHLPDRRFLCEACGQTFVESCDLTAHAKVHANGDSDRPFWCQVCGRWFKTVDALESHRKRRHKRLGRPFRCDACGQSFNRDFQLAEHRSRHHQDSGDGGTIHGDGSGQDHDDAGLVEHVTVLSFSQY